MTIVDTVLNKQIEEGKTPSVQYLFFDKDKIIHEFRHGLADIKGGIKTSEETTYHAFPMGVVVFTVKSGSIPIPGLEVW
jgi:hypothetical protein